MENVILQAIAVLMALAMVGSVFTGALLMWTVRTQVRRIDNLEVMVNEIKTNYIDRFEEVKELMNENNSKAVTELTKVSVTLAKITTKMGIEDAQGKGTQ